MYITVLISDPNHPIMASLNEWAKYQMYLGRELSIVNDAKDLIGGDFLFLVSCSQIINSDSLRKFSHTLVLHASDLPDGRGWSPHVWRVLEGENKITVSILDAASSVDTGDVWSKIQFELLGHELFDEINEKLFKAEIYLMTYVVDSHKEILPIPQKKVEGRYYRKRTPLDSVIDIHKSIYEQFNLLRVCDPNRFPAYFEHLGCKYQLIVKKVQDD